MILPEMTSPLLAGRLRTGYAGAMTGNEGTDWETIGRMLFLGGWASGFVLAVIASLFYRKPGIPFSEFKMMMRGLGSVFEGRGLVLMRIAWGLAIVGTVALFATAAQP